jgi:hypothetical protein
MRHVFKAFLVSLLLSGVALAAPYGTYDLRASIVPADPASGRPEAADGAYLQRVISDLYDHAGSYPPKFDSKPDQERALRDAAVLLKAMPLFAEELPEDQPLQYAAAAVGAVAHNMDIPGGDAVAMKYFGRLLALNPEHPLGNQLFGVHLVGSNRARQGLPYLLKAQSQGVVESSYALCMAYLALGDRQSAVASLERFVAQRPEDQKAAKLLQALRDERTRVEVKNK